MDPMSRGPEEEYGHDAQRRARPGVNTDLPRPPREALPASLGHLKGTGTAGAPRARPVQLFSGDFLLTVNPVDGSEIEARPPGSTPAAPGRRGVGERAELQRAGLPPVPPGPAAPPLPLLERQEQRERLVELLGRGRSVRLVGPDGSGRTALLEAAAAECGRLAPDGLVRLSGYHRTATELLHELCTAVRETELRRPDRAELLTYVRDIGAVVVLDDLEFGGEALDELLDATPECAYLLAVSPEVAPPSAEAGLEEVVLGGLSRASSLELLERAAERPLTDEEANWAGDLWFESEGLPLRFVQAGALLRQRDALRGEVENVDEFEPFASGAPGGAAGTGAPSGSGVSAVDPAITVTVLGDTSLDGADIPLPSIGEGAAPAALLASRLSESARATLRFAVALGGEVPHQAHLPALVGDTHADAALGELVSCGLLSPVGTRYRLAAGVAAQLEEKGYGDDATAHAHTAAQHYAWWSGHPSVTPERVAAEADAILAAMSPLVPAAPAGREEDAGHPSAAVLLARSAAPAFLAALHWNAWERALRTGQEAARLAGEVAEEAYFHHELGVLALCVGNLERARAELEASIAMRGALADKSGTVAGRRALALVADLTRGGAEPGRYEEQAASSALGNTAATAVALPVRSPLGAGPGRAGGVSGRAGAAAGPAAPGTSAYRAYGASGASGPFGPSGPSGEDATLVASVRNTRSLSGTSGTGRRPMLGGARRNLVAAGAGAVLAAVLGTVVTLGATSGADNQGSEGATTEQSVDTDDGAGTDEEAPVEPSDTDSPAGHRQGGGSPTAPVAPEPSGPSASGSPSGSPSAPGSPSDGESATTPGGGDSPSSPGKPPKPPSHSTSPSHTPSGTPSDPPSDPPTDPPTSPPTESPTDPETPPDASASGTAPSITAGAPEPADTTA
ncbi:ATP-binding protein [Streptomyces sp. NPDC088725]|uniref:ATP-binding protein n=1 Tax=Streptomyces sp. NPDC088725 TaxID=3365873 RepID=UPI0037F58131